MAVVGTPKWNAQAVGLSKITVVGWILLGIGLVALLASLLVITRNQREQARQRELRERISAIGRAQLLRAVEHVIYPFRQSSIWMGQYDEPESPLDLLSNERRSHLESLDLNSASPYADGTFETIKWFRILEDAAINGTKEVVTALQIYATYFSPEVMDASTELLNCEFLRIRLLRIHDIVDANTHGDKNRRVPFFWVKDDEMHNAGYREFWRFVAALLVLCGAPTSADGRALFSRP